MLKLSKLIDETSPFSQEIPVQLQAPVPVQSASRLSGSVKWVVLTRSKTAASLSFELTSDSEITKNTRDWSRGIFEMRIKL